MATVKPEIPLACDNIAQHYAAIKEQLIAQKVNVARRKSYPSEIYCDSHQDEVVRFFDIQMREEDFALDQSEDGRHAIFSIKLADTWYSMEMFEGYGDSRNSSPTLIQMDNGLSLSYSQGGLCYALIFIATV